MNASVMCPCSGLRFGASPPGGVWHSPRIAASVAAADDEPARSEEMPDPCGEMPDPCGHAAVVHLFPQATPDRGVDDAQLRQRRVDVRALLLEFGDRLGGLVEHVLHLHRPAFAVRAVEIEVV